jgi:glycosyltransferase involved in cell wall biosynthesis
MASSREGWGLTITECAALGTPSIVWPAPGVVDAVDYGRAGYLCTARTIPCMVAGMERALDDSESYARVQGAAHEYSMRFTPDRAAQAFQNCLERVLEDACESP